MTIAILETGRPPDALSAYGNYADMIEQGLKPRLPDADFQRVHTQAGETAPAPKAVTGVIITGSPAGVYEDHAWISPLITSIQAYAAQHIPMLGICFGHQIMAQALGGQVRKSAKGWGVGVHAYQVSPSGKSLLGIDKLNCIVSHQDQVEEKPAMATVMAHSEFCPIAALAYPDIGSLSFQMHPEFSTDYARALLTHRAGDIHTDVVAAALESYAQPTHRDNIFDAMAACLQQTQR